MSGKNERDWHVTYSAPMAIADSNRRRGHGQAWWSEGLTEEQVNEIRQKIWDIRAKASTEGWTAEQTSTAIHELLAQYGITAQGPALLMRMATQYVIISGTALGTAMGVHGGAVSAQTKQSVQAHRP